ncbi:MAG: hypothetical protein WD100_06310, partial [Tistlia sp.]
MRWNLISVRLVLAIALFGLVASGTILASLVSFRNLNQGYGRLAEQSVPQLIDASRLGQISQSIASTAPTLAMVESEYVRRSVRNQIDDQVSAIDRLLGALVAAGAEGGKEGKDLLAEIRGSRLQLIDNLDELDRAVAERLAAEARLAILLRQARSVAEALIELQGQVFEAAAGLPPPRREAARQDLLSWLGSSELALLDVLSLPSIDNLAVVRRLRDRSIDTFAAASTAKTRLQDVQPIRRRIDDIEPSIARFLAT